MVQVRVGEQDIIDGGGIEAEGFRVFLMKFPSTLIHSTIDQDAASSALDHMAGAGNATISAVK
jgi:hypothetical protein